MSGSRVSPVKPQVMARSQARGAVEAAVSSPGFLSSAYCPLSLEETLSLARIGLIQALSVDIGVERRMSLTEAETAVPLF